MMTALDRDFERAGPDLIRVLVASDDDARRACWRGMLPREEFEVLEVGPDGRFPDEVDVILADRRERALVDQFQRAAPRNGTRLMVWIESVGSDQVAADRALPGDLEVLLPAGCGASELQLACRLQGMRARERRLLDASRRKTRRWRRRALQDPLTRLGNRRAWQRELRRRCAEVLSVPKPLALLLVDIDHFKQVNHQCGYAVGDEVLRGVARLLRDQLRCPETGRNQETPGSRPSEPLRDETAAGYAARLGGDEFGLLAVRHPAALDAWIDRLRQAIRGGSDTQLPPITVSVGAAYVAEQTVERSEAMARGSDRFAAIQLADRLYAAAADALRQAKQRGGDRGVVQRI